MNPFATDTAAERYARGRPYFHPHVVRRIRSHCAITQRVGNALDIACGTGLSSVALLDIAERVVGLDSSQSMIDQAPHDREAISYVVGSAEEMPLEDDSFDLVTVGSAVHWFDQKRFLAEARRVIRDNAWLVLYDNYFTSEMTGNESFREWLPRYRALFPSPQRGRSTIETEDAERAGFVQHGMEEYTNLVEFTIDEFVDYLTSQSNVIAAVEEGTWNMADVRRTLHDQLIPYYDNNPTREIHFSGPIHYLHASTDLSSR